MPIARGRVGDRGITPGGIKNLALAGYAPRGSQDGGAPGLPPTGHPSIPSIQTHSTRLCNRLSNDGEEREPYGNTAAATSWLYFSALWRPAGLLIRAVEAGQS